MNKELIATDAEHSDIMGGSTAAQRIHCPGSYALEQMVPKEKESEFAKEGTALHEAIEHALLECGGNVVDVIGMEFNGVIITRELVNEKLQPAVNAFKQIIDQNGGDCDYIVETRGSLESANMPGCFGTIDIFGRLANGKLLNLDWKFGDGIKVDPAANYQLGFYTACALYTDDEDLEELAGAEDEYTEIVFAIVQPIRGMDGDCYKTWDTNKEWVEDFLDLAEGGYKKALAFAKLIDDAGSESEKQAIINSPEAPLKMGSHCRFCRAAAVLCPLKKKTVSEVVSAKPSIEAMDAITLAKWLDKVEELEHFTKDLRKFARAEADRGVKIPGYMLKPKRASRVYSDPAAAEVILRRQLKVEGAFNKTLITPPQAEKALGKAKYKKLIEKHVTSVSSGYNLTKCKEGEEQATDASAPLQQLGDALKNIENVKLT